jgi:putative ABC transport system permease protein
MLSDIRYALRGLRRSPVFALSVTATIGLGLGVLCSGFSILNAYILKPIDLPEPHTLYELSWDSATVRRHRFTLDDFDALRESSPHFSPLAAASETTVMQEGATLVGLLVTGDFFQLLRVQPALGRTLIPADAAAPDQSAVVVLSHGTWQARFGGDPAIVGKTIVLRQRRFDVVGVLPRGFSLPGQEIVGFYAPLTMATAFDVSNPWNESSPPSLLTFGRLTSSATESQARAWFDVWLHQRFSPGSESAPTAVRVEPRGRRIPLDGIVLSMFLLIMSIFALVLLVACANVTNLVLARGFGRQREIAVRLSLGARRGVVIRQLVVESLVLAAPAAALGLVLTMVTVRVFPSLIVASFPLRAIPFEVLLAPLDPDWRVVSVLAIAAVVSAVLVSLMPALHVTRANLVRASKGDEALDARRSRVRTGLVALQIGACVLFLVAAVGFVDRSTHIANPDTARNYERVADVRMSPRLRAAVVARLAGDPAVERIAAAWRPPMTATLQPLDVLASETRIQQTVGFTVVSSEYFPVFGIRIVRGRPFTAREADEGAALAIVSEATAHTMWPGVDPIGRTLDLLPPQGRSARRPAHASVRVIGVAEDVVSGSLQNGVDRTCVYFTTGFRDPGELSLLVRSRGDMAATKAAVIAAVDAIEKDAPYRFWPIMDMIGGQAWVFKAFSITASTLGVIGLLLAFSGTYAVVAFLVTQRTREFGIRMALGAGVRQLVSGMMGETLRTAAIGLAGGAAVALTLTRAIGSAIPLVPPIALRPYLVAIGIMLLATTTAALLPSLRTTRIDPSKALRVE